MPAGRMRLRDLPDDVNEVSSQVLDAAIEVHRTVGPGLLESVYHRCLAYELSKRGLRMEFNAALPLTYKELVIPSAYFPDLIVEGKVVVDLKAVEALRPEHEAQMLTYLRVTGCRLGMLLNFHAPVLRDGFRRIAL